VTAVDCDVCGLPDLHNGQGDGIGSCDCPRCDGGEAAASSALCTCPPGDDYDDEPCEHEHDEDCYDYQRFLSCTHTHCINCGGCRCPGYCDDYQTCNLRAAETGGTL
jgi:hypothetical protein